MKNIWLGQNGRPGAMAVVLEVLFIIPDDFIKRGVITLVAILFCKPMGPYDSLVTVAWSQGRRATNKCKLSAQACLCVFARTHICV